MKKQIRIRFYEELNDFLPKKKQKKTIEHTLFRKTSVKDLIESFGIPHTEVDLILVNSRSVAFNYPVQHKDLISVYPVFESLDISGISCLRPKPLRVNRFILDVHLGKLARLLRMIGFDTLYRNDYDDPEIIQIALQEKRIILTRDLGILKTKVVTHGYFVRSQYPNKQLKEVIHRFDLKGNLKPLSRCIHCNGSIKAVSKSEIDHLLLNRTKIYYNQFFQCNDCKKLYWEGSHYNRMMEKVATIV